ncbi:hypothetical protein BDW68DRAFT_177243 [Aspergillus falconensis]
MEIASAYESENEEEEEKNALPGLAVTDILLKKVNIFGIEEDLNEDQLPPGGLNPGSVISPHEILWAYDLALGNAERDETNIRAEIDTIMLTTLAVKSAKSSISRGRNRKVADPPVDVVWGWKKQNTIPLAQDHRTCGNSDPCAYHHLSRQLAMEEDSGLSVEE